MTNNIINLVKIFSQNFFTGGLVMRITVLILEILKSSSNLIGFFAFSSGSFFIINLYQYYYVASSYTLMEETFLKYSLLGGIFWVIYALIQYILYKFNYNYRENALIVTIIYLLLTLLAYYLIFKN